MFVNSARKKKKKEVKIDHPKKRTYSINGVDHKGYKKPWKEAKSK